MGQKLIFIGAKWCNQCPAIKRMTAGICDEKGIEMRVLDMDLDADEVARHNPTAMPTIIYGDMRLSGSITRQALYAILS